VLPAPACLPATCRRGRQRQESQLGDADSRFHALGQARLLVHAKAADGAPPGQPPAWGLHCYHGFGSNTVSWSLVQAPLAQRLGALVTAHDMPGFGLTARWGAGRPAGQLAGWHGRVLACVVGD
jgi:pimeloyl-ACP methyl ester carboxylesterase